MNGRPVAEKVGAPQPHRPPADRPPADRDGGGAAIYSWAIVKMNNNICKAQYLARSVFHRYCVCACAKSLQLSLTLFDPMGCSPPGSSVYEILQAGILGWVAISHSREK